MGRQKTYTKYDDIEPCIREWKVKVDTLYITQRNYKINNNKTFINFLQEIMSFSFSYA